MDDTQIQNDKDSIFVILKLFERGQAYTPLLQKIFLYLDPKSLKNCKLTCSKWKEFIDREIWKSISAKKVLYRRLMSNWKDENFVTVNKINLEHRLLYIKGTGFACDENVMVFGGATEASVYRSLTLEKLYSVTLPAIYFTHIGDDFIAFISEQVIIIQKYTGQIEYHEQIEAYSCSQKPLRMIGNKNGVLWSQARMRIEMRLKCFLVI